MAPTVTLKATPPSVTFHTSPVAGVPLRLTIAVVAASWPNGAAWVWKAAWNPPADRRTRISSLPCAKAVKSLPRRLLNPSAIAVTISATVWPMPTVCDTVCVCTTPASTKPTRMAQVAPTTGAPASVRSETLAVPARVRLPAVSVTSLSTTSKLARVKRWPARFSITSVVPSAIAL